MGYAEHVKSVLEQNIDNLFINKNKYCYNPDKDFTRTRKLGFKEVIKLLITMEGGTLNSELLKHFDYSPDAALSSAFVQQRHKIKENAFVDLFNNFNNSFPFDKTFMGYRLIACDGSDFNIYSNPNDSSTYYQTSPDIKGYNMMHLDACYDLCNRRYTDVIVNPGQEFNEPGAMVTMMERYAGPRKTIFIADRGYESYNIFAHAVENNLKFLIRVKDRNSSGMLKGYADELPETDEFDVNIERVFTRGWTKERLAHPEKYKIIPSRGTFDYLKSKKDTYVMGFRVLRFKISDGSYECIITNLPREEFDLPTVKRLYGMRWGIETSFRELKYAIGMTAFHSRIVPFVRQEVFARIIMYNFCEIITTHTIVERENLKYEYHVNYTMAIILCRKYVMAKKDSPALEIEKLLRRYIQPIRPGRKDRRKVVKNQPSVSFIYRVAA
jgi:hypothetical protein